MKFVAMILTLAMLMAVVPGVVHADVASPIIPSITIRPPEIFEDDDLTITFTNVYDAIGRADITMQSAMWFYLAPNGTFSFNRDIELLTETEETLTARAGEVMSLYGHPSLGFIYGEFPIPPEHTPSGDIEGLYRSHSFGFLHVNPPVNVPMQNEWTQLVSNYAVTTPAAVTTTSAAVAARTLRFAIGSTTFTDNGTPRTLEAAPFIAQARTMVPLRVIVEALGATNLEFDAGVITFVLSGENITMTVGQPLPGNMGTPVIVADRTFVPLRYITEEIGATARWDGDARAAYIYM